MQFLVLLKAVLLIGQVGAFRDNVTCNSQLKNNFVDATFSLCSAQLISLRGRYSTAQGLFDY